MNSILIIDNQPLLRLGLKRLISANYKGYHVYEAGNALNLPSSIDLTEMSIIVWGLEPDSDVVDIDDIHTLRNKFPQANLIVYSDNISHWRSLTGFSKKAVAYISKQASEKEHICCLQSVMDGKTYVYQAANQ